MPKVPGDGAQGEGGRTVTGDVRAATPRISAVISSRTRSRAVRGADQSASWGRDGASVLVGMGQSGCSDREHKYLTRTMFTFRSMFMNSPSAEEVAMSTTSISPSTQEPVPAHYKRPDWFTRNIFNSLVKGLTRMGVSVWGSGSSNTGDGPAASCTTSR